MANWKFWEKKDKKPQVNPIESLGLKIHSDNVLSYRISMVYLLHLAVEGGDVELPGFIDIDEKDKNLQTLKEIRDLTSSDDPKDRINAIKLQLKFMDLVLRTVSIPWLRAGDNNMAARCLRGWEGLFSKSKAMTESVSNLLTRADEGGILQRYMDKSEIISNLKIFLILVTFRLGLLISDVAYKDTDVQPSQIAILYQMGTDSGGGPTRKVDPLFSDNTNIRSIIREELDNRNRR